MQRGADLAISNNTFSAQIAPDSTFTLTSLPFVVTPPIGSVYSSIPVPGSTLMISGPVGTLTTTTLNIRNIGKAGSSLDVGAPVLSGPNPAAFTISPTAGFSLAAGAAPQPVTVGCTPAAPVTFTATLTFPIVNDPASSSASYTLNCTGLSLLVVTEINDDGTRQPGTLSAALNTYTLNNIITFILKSGNTVHIMAPLTINRGPVVIDGGSCAGGVPGITLEGSGAALNATGLTLDNPVVLKNLKVVGFKGKQIIAKPGGSQFGTCLVVSSGS